MEIVDRRTSVVVVVEIHLAGLGHKYLVVAVEQTYFGTDLTLQWDQ